MIKEVDRGSRKVLDLRTQFESLSSPTMTKVDRVYEAVLKSIEKGNWVAGDKLPTEQDLAGLLPVSLGTIQSAMNRLTNEGVVVRKRRDGSRIAGISQSNEDALFFQFVDDKTGPLSVSLSSFDLEVTREQGRWAEFITGTEFIRITRTMNVGNQFSVLTKFYINAKKYGTLMELDRSLFSEISIRRILAEQFKSPALAVEHVLRFVTLEPSVASTLGIASGTQGVCLEVIAYTYRDEPLCYIECLIPDNSSTIQLPRSSQPIRVPVPSRAIK